MSRAALFTSADLGIGAWALGKWAPPSTKAPRAQERGCMRGQRREGPARTGASEAKSSMTVHEGRQPRARHLYSEAANRSRLWTWGRYLLPARASLGSRMGGGCGLMTHVTWDVGEAISAASSCFFFLVFFRQRGVWALAGPSSAWAECGVCRQYSVGASRRHHFLFNRLLQATT